MKRTNKVNRGENAPVRWLDKLGTGYLLGLTPGQEFTTPQMVKHLWEAIPVGQKPSEHSLGQAVRIFLEGSLFVELAVRGGGRAKANIWRRVSTYKVLVVGGEEGFLNRAVLPKLLQEYGLEAEWVWDKVANRALPAKCDGVILFRDLIPGIHDDLRTACREAEIPFLSITHQLSKWDVELRDRFPSRARPLAELPVAQPTPAPASKTPTPAPLAKKEEPMPATTLSIPMPVAAPAPPPPPPMDPTDPLAILVQVSQDVLEAKRNLVKVEAEFRSAEETYLLYKDEVQAARTQLGAVMAGCRWP